MPIPPRRYNPRTYRYLHRDPGLAIGQLTQVELCFERPGFEHNHGDWQVMFLLEGRATVTAGGEPHPLKPGDVCVVPPRVVHRTDAAAGRPIITLVDLRLKLTPEVSMTRYLERIAAGGVVSWTGDLATITREARALRWVLERVDRPDPPHVLGPLWHMLSRPLDEASLPDPAAHAGDSRVLYVISTMREHLDREISIVELADAVQLSTSQLSRLFREHVDASPTAYLQGIRLEQAQQYLTSSTMSVKQIAAACGFGNANHFSRLFHERVGSTPTAFRKAAGSRHDG